MIYQKIRKTGNSYVITIPREEMERLAVKEGDLIAVQLQPVEIRPLLSPEKQRALDESWAAHEEAYRVLGEN